MQRSAPFQIVFPCLALTVVGLVLGATGLQTNASEQKGIPLSDFQGLVADSKAGSTAYTRAMLVGYTAAEQGDYHTALINFRRALAARPGDRYATAAIRNMETYIAQERAAAQKRADIEELQSLLSRAVEASDWACAASTVDRLIPLVPPDSVDRARLTAYRGELAGLIQSRASLEQWSTVCLGGSPE